MGTKTEALAKDARSIPVANGRIESSDIFRGGNELFILHNGFEYKLRLTGTGKLILTK